MYFWTVLDKVKIWIFGNVSRPNSFYNPELTWAGRIEIVCFSPKFHFRNSKNLGKYTKRWDWKCGNSENYVNKICRIQTWSLVCETQLSRSIKCGTVFQLRQGNDVSLLCQIQKMPHFNIVEELLHSSSSNRLFNFNFKNNSETPV